jgi:hypothetical protein
LFLCPEKAHELFFLSLTVLKKLLIMFNERFFFEVSYLALSLVAASRVERG